MPRLYRGVVCFLVAWYCGVCLVHYFGQRPLWNDEQAVFSSIGILKPHELFTEPLRMVQVFPHLYLFIIQALSKIFNHTVLSLRFLPFVAMMCAFFIWLRIAKKELNKAGYLTFLLCWIGSVPLVYYSAELKQYSLDVLIAGLFVSTLYGWEKLCQKGNGRLLIPAAALMPAAVLLSYPAYFFVIFPLWNLIRDVKEGKVPRYVLVIYAASLLICGGLSYQFDVRLRPVEIVTGGFNDYFVATNSWPDFVQTLSEGINNLFSRWFVELPKIFRKLARFFMFFGLINLSAAFFMNIKKSNGRFGRVGGIALIVFLELIVAAAFKKYPLGVPRTALFLCPMLLILTIQGISAVKHFNRYVYFAVHGAFVVYLLVTAAGIAQIVFNQPLTSIPTLWAL